MFVDADVVCLFVLLFDFINEKTKTNATTTTTAPKNKLVYDSPHLICDKNPDVFWDADLPDWTEVFFVTFLVFFVGTINPPFWTEFCGQIMSRLLNLVAG